MAPFSWKRLRQSIGDVATWAEKGRALVIRGLAWLAMVGLPVLAGVNADTLLPPTISGRLLWAAVVLAALVLEVQAVYRVRSETEMPPMASPDFALMIQMRQLAGRTVGMFGIEDGRFDVDGLRASIEELKEYRYTLRHHGKLTVAIRRYHEALEHVVAQAEGMPEFGRVDAAEERLYEVCREYEASNALAGKSR